MSRLSGIRAYVEAASPGPWDVVLAGISLEPTVLYSFEPADFKFIARARTDLPLLLEVAERARALVLEVRTSASGSRVEQLRAALARLEAGS